MKILMLFTSIPAAVRAFSTHSQPRSSLQHSFICHRRPFLIRLFHSVDDDNRELYIKSYKISGRGKGSAVDMKTNTEHILKTDVPIKMGGQNTAAQPVEHLLAALIGCTQATAVYVGRMMKPRLIIDNIEFDIEGYRDERGALQMPIEKLPSTPARLEHVSGVVRVQFKKNITVSAEELSLLKEQTEARCPVANMMHASGCRMDIEWIDATKS